jgi:nucleotide-binding universal stress UspA family protein
MEQPRLAVAVNNLDVAAKRLQMLKEAVPKMKGVVMLVYAAPEAPHRTRGHLHNTPLQILVERGVLGLLAWAWIFIAFFQRAAAVLAGGRRGPDRRLVMGAVRAIVGFLVGGLTEYNFGDSEVVLIAYVTLSIWEKGRRYLVVMLSPLEASTEGTIDLAARNGLKTIGLIGAQARPAIVKGALELARKKGLDVVVHETFPPGTTDFSAILNKVKAAKPDAVVVGAPPADAIAITRQMRELDVNVKMYGATPGGSFPDYQKALGKTAEFVYAGSYWDPALPYPGNREFVATYQKEFTRAPSSNSASSYAGCQLFVDAVRRAGSLDSDKLREELLKVKAKTLFGDFAVDERGFQIGHKAITVQWQDSKSVGVWPDEVATGKPRFPTPAWSGR